MSETEAGMSLDQHLFQLTCLVSASDIKLSARSEVGSRQLLALVMGSGDLTFHYLSGEMDQIPVMKRVPWFVESNKRITALCFDPMGSWLLVAGNDGSIFIVPALSLVDPNAVLDHRWSTTDLTSFPSPLLHANPSSNSCNANIQRSRPTSIVWWQSLLECHHVAIMGTDCGDLIFVSLNTGLQVGITFVRATVSMLHICQDNSLDSVFLLITSDKRSQWKLLLEQRATGYGWPIDSSGSAVKVVTSNNELGSSGHTTLELEFGNRSGSYLPTTRSRLQGLKQLSVEKLTSLRQRLAETRSKGAAAMAVNIHFRRESSGSSSDDTTCSSTVITKPGTTEGSDLPPIHHVTTGPQPERLSSEVGDTFLCPQSARGRHLLSGYYAPTSILSIHGMSLDVVPLFVHKLAPQCRDVLVTDRFLYVTDRNGKNLSVVSCQLSESRIGGDSDYNPGSVIETFEMKGSDERILSLYKRTDLNDRHRKSSAGVSSRQSLTVADKDFNQQVSVDTKSRSSSREKEKKSSQTPFCLPKSVKELKLDMPSIDTCVIVTTTGVYEVTLRLSPAEVFMDLALTHQALEKAERLALVFGLNLQHLLEAAGDLKLSAREFPQAIALYKLSRCRHLKSVLKFAAAGHASELLSYITLLFSTAGLDLTMSERIHLSNLAVMSHTEQVLRATSGRVILFKQFLKFLRENLYYDEVLAVNVAGQTGLWEVLQFLASFRGLHPEVLDILTKIVRSLGEGLVKAVEKKTAASKRLPALDSGLWLCVSDPSLLQSLLSKPQQAKIHLQFVRTCLPYLEQFALQRLAALYDPSSPQLRPSLKRMFKIGRRREHSSGSYSSYSTQMDSLDLLDSVDEIFVPGEDIVLTFLLVLLHLAKKRQVSSFAYVPELMEKIQLAKDDDEDSEDLCPSLPVRANTLSAGFSHVALVRNGAIYTWGNAVQGCLGTGPTMSRYSCPQQVSILPSLKLEVISVTCGRQHTLVLTNNGVYAWGSSQYGQLGIGKTGQCPYPRLVEHLSRERIIAVSAGQYHSIALADDGRVFTWGWGVHGQLGHHSVEDCHTPTLVERLIGKVVTQICGGHGHTVVLTAEGHVYTFGSSVFGQLGNGSNVKSSVPVHVAALTERITLISTNYFHNLAVSNTNKLYMWGSSPQVLRLQAQAQKKARLLQQQQLSSSTTFCANPSSPSRSQSSPSRSTRPITAQVHSTPDINSEKSGSLLESHNLATAAKPDRILQDPQEHSSTYHNPTFTESLEGKLPNSNLKTVLNSCDPQMLSVDGSCSSTGLLTNQDLSAEANVNMEDTIPSHSELLSGNANSLNSSSSNPNSAMKLAKCHKFSSGNDNTTSEACNKECANNRQQSSQSSRELPVPKGEAEVTHVSDSDRGTQEPRSSTLSSNMKQEFEPSCDKTLLNKNSLQSSVPSQDSPSSARPVPSSMFSDFENANMDTSSGDLPSSQFASRKMDQNLVLKDSPDTKSDNQSAQSEPVDDGQSHLTPQTVDTSLVVGPIIQVSCGCHHSALLTRDGVLYMWGRNLDGQLGSGSRKEILVPTPLISPAASAATNTKGSSTSSQPSTMPRSPSLSAAVNGGEKPRLRQVSCGCEFTIAQENTSAGKIWAWGNNSQAQLGRVPIEDTKGLEGKLVMLKTTKRVIKLPHGSQNSCDVPREVPGLPNSTISFKYDSLSGIGGCCGYVIGTCTELCPPLCSVEEPCYGLRTLHYTFQHFYGHYDSTYLLNKCLELENYQGAAKLAALDRHYHLALAYQLKALALATMESGFDAQKHHETLCTDFSRETNNSKRTLTKGSNLITKGDHLNEDKMRSTNFSHNSNETKDRNSNPLIVNYKEQLSAHVTNGNSNCISSQQLEVNSNAKEGATKTTAEINESDIRTNSNTWKDTIINTKAVVKDSRSNGGTAQCDENNDTAVNKMRKESSISSTADFQENVMNIEDLMTAPQNSSYENKIVTEPKTEEVSESITDVKNRNQINTKINLVYNSKNESEAMKDNNMPKDKTKVEFSEEICTQLNEGLNPNSKLPLTQSCTDKTNSESEKEEDLKLEQCVEDSKQETNLSADATDHISNKIQVSPIEEEIETNSSISTPESLTSANAPDSEIHAFAVQGGTEQMSEGHRYLTSPDSSTSPLVSEEQGLLSPEPFLPQVNEQSSPNAGVNLIPMNENGDFQSPADISPDDDKEKALESRNENPNRCETELITDSTPLLTSDTKPSGNSESLMKVNKENVVENKDFNFTCINDGTGLQSNSEQVSPAVESNSIALVKQFGKKERDICVKNDGQKVTKESDNIPLKFQSNMLHDKGNIPDTKSVTTSDICNGMIDKADNLNKAFTSNDPNRLIENRSLLDNTVGSHSMNSDCSQFQPEVELASKSTSCKNSGSNSLVEGKLTNNCKQPSVTLLNVGLESSLPSTQSDTNIPDAVAVSDGRPAERALETIVRGDQSGTKQACSDRIDLENYENELKVSSGDKDLGLAKKAINVVTSIKSTDIVRDEVSDNTYAEKMKSVQIDARNDLVSLSEASESASSKTTYGNSAQNADKTDGSNTTETNACKDLVGQAAAVVEYYVSVMEEDSHTMMRRLLQQGIEFWLSHSLPVDHLENLLLKHMSKFFYPLGLLLFCKDSNTGEEEVETQQHAMSMLNHLSTRFCLQLCSSLLNHIDQRKAYPEYIELLAQVTSMQTAPGLNGCYVTGQTLSQSPEQLMEAILEGLGATKGLGGPLGQTFINLQEDVSETCKDPSSETAKLEQLLAFSCGHHYGQSVFHQSVLPELELGLLQLHHPLPNTARVLKGLFGSNSPNLHLACPRCVLSYLQSQTTPPL